MNYDRYFVKDKKTGILMHKAPIKVIINPILRLIQFYSKAPYVIFSVVDIQINENPKFIKFGFGRVKIK